MDLFEVERKIKKRQNYDICPRCSYESCEHLDFDEQIDK